jgi:hypothetical protein
MSFEKIITFCGVALLCLLLLLGAQAHVPITTGDNEALDTATHIPDPLKSWAIYSELRDGGVANYFQFDMEQGQRLRLSLFTPRESSFTPGLVIMGPDIEPQGTVPSFIEVPEGLAARVAAGTRPETASYEPFTPSSLYELVDVDTTVNASGTYYVAVYEPSQGGQYGLAVGYREQFELLEWIRVPLDIVTVHQWEGQFLIFILAPMLGIVALGFVLLFLERKRGVPVLQSPFSWLGSFVSFLYIGSGATILAQMGIALTVAPVTSAVIITVIFALLPIIAGIVLLKVVLTAQEEVTVKKRIEMAILGIVGLFIWAGLLVGPVLAIVTSLLPPFTKGNSTLK